MTVDLSWLNQGVDQPLPAGVTADPTYLAFLRGVGMDQSTAWATAIQHISSVQAAYQTAVERDPQILKDAIRGVNGTYSANGNFFSGGRLEDVAQKRVEDEQRRADQAGAQAQGISDAQLQLRQNLSTLARQNVDQIGALQGRHDERAAQDRYIGAVRQQALARAGGGSGFDPYPPGATSAPPAAPALPSFLAGMSPAEAAAFRQRLLGQPATVGSSGGNSRRYQ